jgi:CheY-like chemotaxis protein
MAGKQPHIMVLNDDAIFLDVMNDLLTEEGFRVTLVRESRKAYELVRAERPDLLALDIRMGNELTGFELISLLTLDPVTHAIPLIVASADSQALREHEAQLANQNIGVLHKPFDLEDLLRLIREKLGQAAEG